MDWMYSLAQSNSATSVLDARSSSEVLIVALHGWRQVPTGARWAYLDFAKMTGLRQWCQAMNFSLFMPMAPQGRNWSADTDKYVLDRIHEVTRQLHPLRLYVYGFSDGADQAIRIGKMADGVVFHSGVRVQEAVPHARQIVRNGRLVLVSTAGDRTPADARVERIAEQVPAAQHVVMPRRSWWGLNHYWTPETNPIVWDALRKAPNMRESAS